MWKYNSEPKDWRVRERAHAPTRGEICFPAKSRCPDQCRCESGNAEGPMEWTDFFLAHRTTSSYGEGHYTSTCICAYSMQCSKHQGTRGSTWLIILSTFLKQLHSFKKQNVLWWDLLPLLGKVLIPVSCTISRTSVHSSSGTLSDLVP